MFGIAAAVMLELKILTDKFWKEGFAVGNIYSRLSTYILVLVPGFALVVLPMIVAIVTFFFVGDFVLEAFLATVVAEFISMVALLSREK
jgi:hypothetical protein